MNRGVSNSGKVLRPHGKTHKSGWIAREQVAAGAVGLTCAKPAEAEIFAAADIQDIRIAYPIAPTYAPRILSLMDGVRISTIVDDLDEIPKAVRGIHPRNPVNLPPGGGVQLELPPRVRRGTGVPTHDPAYEAAVVEALTALAAGHPA